MAERKSGPVKPPVIDLTARETPEPTDAENAAPQTDDAPKRKATAARRSARSRSTAASKPNETPAPADSTETESSATPDSGPPADSAPKPSTPEPTRPAPADDPVSPRVDAAPEEISEPADTVSSSDNGQSTMAGPPLPPRPPARLAMPWSAISVAALGGAILGAGLTYLAANWIALPRQDPPYPDPTAMLTDLATSLDALDTRLSAVEDTARTTRVSLDATLAQLDTATAELSQQITDSVAAIPEPQTVDLSAIEAELQTLESRVTAIAAGASSDDASALANNLSGIETTLGGLSERRADFESRIADGDGRITALAGEMADAQAAITAQTRTLGGANIGPAVKLPLIVSGLESAFANGRAYAAELSGLTTLLPDLTVPPTLADKAEGGLPRPDAIASRFDAALPDIIAGQTRESTGDFAQDAVEWAKALLALRPTEELEGDTPEAVVSRLEAAVDRRDFVAAATELAQLPAPMQQAAGAVGTDIATLAQAATFITRLRAEALAPAMEPAS